MKEAYVSYEVAKLLKEKGFDWDTDKVYERSLMAYRYEDYPMPTQVMACDWLKEEKGIYISVVPDFNEYGEYPDDLYWFARVYDLIKGDYIHSTKLCVSSQEAFETAIQYVLTNLI